MTFDIHAIDDIDSTIDDAEEEVNSYRDELLSLFKESPEGQRHLQKYPDTSWWAKMLIEFGFRYLNVSVPQFDAGIMDEIFMELFPRKVTLEKREEALDAVPELIAFWSFLKREFELEEADSILEYLNSCSSDEFADSMFDLSKAGTAKALVLPAVQAGVDITDPKQMNEYMALYNAAQTVRFESERNANRKSIVKEKKKRKAEKAARKRNRKR